MWVQKYKKTTKNHPNIPTKYRFFNSIHVELKNWMKPYWLNINFLMLEMSNTKSVSVNFWYTKKLLIDLHIYSTVCICPTVLLSVKIIRLGTEAAAFRTFWSRKLKLFWSLIGTYFRFIPTCFITLSLLSKKSLIFLHMLVPYQTRIGLN